MKQLVDYQAQLEGQLVVVQNGVNAVRVNARAATCSSPCSTVS